MAARATFRGFVRVKRHLYTLHNGPRACLRVHHIQKRFIQSSATLWDATRINMPALSPTMQEGTIIQWHKKEGDTVAPGDVLCDIQTDKSTIGFETEEEGILAKILIPDNTSNVKLGALIGLMVEEGDDWQSVEVPAATDAACEAAASTASPTPVTAQATGDQPSSSSRYGPAINNMLNLYNIEMNSVEGTGPHGRILKGDLLRYIKEKNLSPVTPGAAPVPEVKAPIPATPARPLVPIVSASARPPPKSLPASTHGEYSDLELTTMRSIIAKRLTESKTTIPHSYAAIDCNISKLLQLRKDLKADGIKVSVNDFIIKASAAALRAVPEANAIWSGTAPRVMAAVDISVAVATDSGLITPIVKNVDLIGLEAIAASVKDLATRARGNKLRPEEFQGGTFTISNLGMFGITEFSAVINPPQACILAIGGTRSVLAAEGGMNSMMIVTLSSDGRIVDDHTAAQFLEAFRNAMENPISMLSAKTSDNTTVGSVSKEALFAK